MAPLTYTTAEIAEMVFRHPDPDSRAAAELVRRAGLPGRLPGRRPPVYAREAIDRWLAEHAESRPQFERQGQTSARRRRKRRGGSVASRPVKALLEEMRNRGKKA